ncbi:hypothetical protein Pelo_3262 [Pelomyxa schiedti]|nr:hypothetical protein Pelo_3262 [Pelomyxa schiedti]
MASTTNGLVLARDKLDEARRIMMISQSVWPPIVAWLRRKRRPLRRDHAVWVLGVAEALFPLVPVACREVLAAPIQVGLVRTLSQHGSRYALLMNAAMAGDGDMRCVRWALQHKATRNIEKECLAVLWGLCGAGRLPLAQELTGGGGGGGGGDGAEGAGESPGGWRGTGLVWPRDGDCWEECWARDRPVHFVRWRGAEVLDTGGCEITKKNVAHHCCSAGECRLYALRNSALSVEDEGNSLLSEICRGGSLDTAKWAVSRFQIRDQFEFATPFCCALSGGHLELAQWLCTTHFDVMSMKDHLCFNRQFPIYQRAGESGSMPLVKWFVGEFHVDNPKALLFGFMSSKKKTPVNEFVEGIEWLQAKFSLSLKAIQHCAFDAMQYQPNFFRRLSLLERYFMDTIFDEEKLSRLFSPDIDVGLMKWMLGKGFKIAPEHFLQACGNRKEDSVGVLMLMSQMISLAEIDVEEALISAVASNNPGIAEWIDTRFQVMNKVNANAINTNATFMALFDHINDQARKYWLEEYNCLDGVLWFLQHLRTQNIEECSVAEVLEVALPFEGVALALLKCFRLPFDNHKSIWERCLDLFDDLADTKELISLGNFTQEDITSHLSTVSDSSKTVKWLIQEFHLSEDQVKSHNNELLHFLILSSKTMCAEWLIRTFHITLDEVLKIWVNAPKEVEYCDYRKLSTWRMLLRVFPETTLSMVKERLMDIALASPCHIEFTMRKLGLTFDDIIQRCRMRGSPGRLGLPIQMWLYEHWPTPSHST